MMTTLGCSLTASELRLAPHKSANTVWETAFMWILFRFIISDRVRQTRQVFGLQEKGHQTLFHKFGHFISKHLLALPPFIGH